MDFSSGEHPYEPCVHSSEAEFPFFCLLARSRHIFQDPSDLLDVSVQLGAVAYNQMEYDAALKAAEEKKQAALNDALERSKAGTEEYAQAEAAILAEYEAETQTALQTYLANTNQVWSGIAKAMAHTAANKYGTIQICEPIPLSSGHSYTVSVYTSTGTAKIAGGATATRFSILSFRG